MGVKECEEFGGGLDMVYVGEDGELEEHGTDRNGY